MNTRTLPILAIGIVLASPAAAQQSPTKLRVAYDGFSMTSGPLIYADKQGIFKKFGLDIAPVFIDGKKAVTLRGPTVAADFKQMVIDYIDRRFGHGGAGRTAAE